MVVTKHRLSGGRALPGHDLPWRRTEAAALAGILAVALLLRLASVAAIPSPVESDYRLYYTMASNLYAGNGLAGLDGKPTAFLSVGYPLFLRAVFAVTGVSVLAGELANVVLGLVSVGLAYVAARRLWGNRLVAGLAGLLAATYLESIVCTAYLAKENLMTPLMLGLLVVASSRPRGAWQGQAALFGVLAGCLAVVGNAGLALLPGLLTLIVVLAPGLVRSIKFVVVFAVVATLTTAPVLWRNHEAFGAWVLNNNGGFNLYIGNNPNAGPTFQSITETPIGPDWQALYARLGERGVDELTRKLALDYIGEHPGATAVLAAQKAIAFWTPPLHAGREGNSGLAETVVRMAWFLQFCLICLLFITSGLRWRSDRRALLVLGLLVAGYTGIHMVFYVGERYRQPLMLVLCIGAGAGADIVLRAVRNRGRGTALAAGPSHLTGSGWSSPGR